LRRAHRKERELHDAQRQALIRDSFQKKIQFEKQLALTLHDEVGQDMTALKFSLALTGKTGDSLQELNRIAPQVDAIIQRIRQISREIRPPVLSQSVGQILRHLAAEHVKKYTMPCDVDVEPEIDLPEEVRTVIFQVAQEALTNVVRHAHATHVWLSCRYEDGFVRFEIRDNGVGIQAERMNRVDSYGLTGMRERAGMVGGRLEIERGEENGTVIRVVVPLEQGKEEE